MEEAENRVSGSEAVTGCDKIEWSGEWNGRSRCGNGIDKKMTEIGLSADQLFFCLHALYLT